jgi:hypothetical protein
LTFIIEHQCPQCGAPAELEETDRFFECGFCRVRSYLSVPDVFRYALPHHAPPGSQLIYFPYWRFKGMLFSCVPGSIQERFVDVNQQAILSAHFPFSMGLRSQTQKLRLAVAADEGIFLTPRLGKADLLKHLHEQFSLDLPKPILHQACIGETISLMYAPFYLAGRLMDGIINTAVENGAADAVEPLLQDRQEPSSWPLHFLATLCPNCGWDLSGERDALALTCTNCRSVWWSRKDKLERLAAAHVPDPRETTVYLPFWRIQADISGIQLNSYADLIHVANMPKVAQPGWEKLPFHFWSPAFKAQPRSFLRFAAHVTTAQPQDTPVPGLPEGAMRSVTLPLPEAVESLTLILAFFAKPRQRMEALLPTIKIKARRALLVYLPFQEGIHELIHPDMHLAISKNLLAHARNL